MRALVTGATGYVGSRLVTALLTAGVEVLATARSAEKMDELGWSDQATEVSLDVTDEASTRAALTEHGPVDVAYYLVHAIGDANFAAEDKNSAATFAREAAAAGVGRIVYLGGFVPEGEELSEHLASRDEVGQELGRTGVELVWLRAAVIIGAGSTSYEMIRYLADRLPVVPIPTWVRHEVAPIAVDDVLHYLVAALRIPPGSYDITGPDTLPYTQLFSAYVRAAGLHRWLMPTPGVPTALAGKVIGAITPLPPELAADLVQSMHNTMTGDPGPIRALVPDPPGGLTTVADAMRRAQVRPGIDRGDLADVDDTPDPLRLAPTDPRWAGGDAFRTQRSRRIDASAARVWAVLQGMGGEHGYFSWPLAWRVRGHLDRWAGGSGNRVRRADPRRLTKGDVLGFLTVTVVREPGYLCFDTNEHNPGTGSLELRLDPVEQPVTLHLCARFLPRGTAGRLYWWALKPFHMIIFSTMLRRIEALALADPADGTGIDTSDGQTGSGSVATV